MMMPGARRGKLMIATASLLLAACSAGPAMTPPAAPPTAMPQSPREPITRSSPLLDVMPLSAGASWSYIVGRSDQCLSKSSDFTVDGVMTETVTSAWQQGDAIVYEVQAESNLFNLQLQQKNYYVVLNGRLYYALNSPDRIINARGEGCESMEVLAWPLSVGQSVGAWKVAAEELPLIDADLPATCYRLEQRTNNSAHDAWFCPGLGFVQYRDQSFVSPVSDETRKLHAISMP